MKSAKAIHSSREIASIGFQNGFQCAVRWVEGLSQHAEDPDIRQVAALIAKVMPESERAAREAFLQSLTILLDKKRQ